MARIYSGKKGKASSHRPPYKTVPKWLKYNKEDIEKIIVDLSKQKHTSAMIGTILRDSYGIPDSTVVTEKPISEIMKENSLYPTLPEDLMFLLRKAVSLKKHMTSFKKDKHSQRGLENLESKIRRLVKYYVRKGKLPKSWAYNPEQARLIVEKW
ncbi:MAG: 30S ribosomal protein S15 [Candidatus Aenigmarchaeota archaeon]|nr:30S ribosomal protein S15 [Candidatus Aenigmarchaeota archaeon]